MNPEIALIYILGIQYTVRTVPTRSPELVDGHSYAYGIHNYSTSQIVIDMTVSDHVFLSTLRHEIAHAMFDVCCLNVKENFTEEDICEIIGMHAETISSLAKQAFNQLRRIQE